MKQAKHDPPLDHSAGVVVRATSSKSPRKLVIGHLANSLGDSSSGLMKRQARVILTATTNERLVPYMRAIRRNGVHGSSQTVLIVMLVADLTTPQD